MGGTQFSLMTPEPMLSGHFFNGKKGQSVWPIAIGTEMTGRTERQTVRQTDRQTAEERHRDAEEREKQR